MPGIGRCCTATDVSTPQVSEAFPTLHMILPKETQTVQFRHDGNRYSGECQKVHRDTARVFLDLTTDGTLHTGQIIDMDSAGGGFFSCLVRESDTKLRKSSICVEVLPEWKLPRV